MNLLLVPYKTGRPTPSNAIKPLKKAEKNVSSVKKVEAKPIVKPVVKSKRETESGNTFKGKNIERGSAFGTKSRPQAILHKKTDTETMAEEKLKYSEEELKEFEVIIMEKLDKAKHELNYMKEMLSKKNDEGTDNTAGTMKLLEDGADTLEKENFSQLAARQQKFVTQLENAMARIKNGTYGICIETGKLIPKERLKAVPHTQHSIEAKLNRKD
jgi:RNA polymerase-binding transcription factor DksA